MKKHCKILASFLILHCSFFIINCNAQTNLVNNYSFEQHSSCPDNSNQISRAIGWQNMGETPDLFSACSTNPDFSVPYNIVGFQTESNNDSSYAGIVTYAPDVVSNYREFIGSELSSPLSIGEKYYITYKVSLTKFILFGNTFKCATDNIGILFSTIPYTISSPPLLNNFSHISSSLITDSINWVTVSGSFIADSAYKYVILGNFHDDNNTDTLKLDGSTICNSYYYVDDICVSSDSITCNIPTSINDKINIDNTGINIYPNPFKYSTKVEVNNNFSFHKLEYQIYNSIGQEVYRNTINGRSFVIERKNLPEGIYILKLHINKKIFTNKLIINN